MQALVVKTQFLQQLLQQEAAEVDLGTRAMLSVLLVVRLVVLVLVV